MLNASIQFSSVMFDSLPPHGLQHARLPCSSPAPGACSDSCPSSQWCHPTIKFSVIPFSSCLQSFPVSGTFLMIQFFALGGQSVEASVLAVNIQDWFPLGLTDFISLLSKGLSRDFCSTTVRKLRASRVALVVKDLTASAGNVRELGLTLGQEDPLEKEMATDSCSVA